MITYKKIRKKDFCVFVIQLLAVISENIVLNISMNSWYLKASIFVLINFSIQFLYFWLTLRIFSVGCFFILVSYLFQVPYVILFAAKMVPTDSIINIVHMQKHGESSFMAATIFGINCIAGCFLGYVIIAKKCSMEEYNGKNINYLRLCKKIGGIIAFIFGVLYFISVFYQISSVLSTRTYHVLIDLKSNLILRNLRNVQIFYFAGLYLIMLYYQKIKKKKESIFCFIIATLSAFACFFTGSRGTMMAFFMAIIIFWFRDVCETKIKFKTIVLLAVVLVFLLRLLYAIRVVRNQNFTMENVMLAFFNKSNLLYETFSEFGVSVFCTSALMNVGDSSHPIVYLIREVVSIFPKISQWGGEIFIAPTVLTGVEAKYAIGTTYIAEFYYYFGNFAPMVISILGAWLAFWDNKMESLRKSGRYIELTILFCWAGMQLTDVRSSASFNLKFLLYSFIIIKFFESLICRGNRLIESICRYKKDYAS